MSNPVIVVVGSGPGLGAAVARRYGQERYDVALLARSAEPLEELGHSLQAAGITTWWSAVDITDDRALREAIRRFGRRTGRIDVLHFNPSAFRHKTPLELAPEELLADLRLGVAGLLTAVQGARPFLRDGARVTATGSQAADDPWNEAASLGVQKAGLRNLVRSLDTTLAPEGIRATSLTVYGTLAPDTAFSPERVADALYWAAKTPAEQWQPEIPYRG